MQVLAYGLTLGRNACSTEDVKWLDLKIGLQGVLPLYHGDGVSQFPVTEQACKSTTQCTTARQLLYLDSGPETSILQQALPMGIDDAVQS